jgi:quinol monooxygenase YgiN
MLVVVVRFRVRAGFETAFAARVREQAGASLGAEPGCRRFDVCVDPHDAGQVLLYEIYSDASAFDLHLRSAHYLAFDRDTREWIAEKVVERWQLLVDRPPPGGVR